jgi:acyl-coenzyme A synthetase/AMP-(fatty) acid ligase
MIELNLKPKDTVCILGKNIPEWSIVNLAAMMIGCVPVVNRFVFYLIFEGDLQNKLWKRSSTYSQSY